MAYAKLVTLIGDLDSLPTRADRSDVDDVFITLGMNRAQVPGEAARHRGDHDYPVQAATLAQASGATGVFLVTIAGASAAASIFYVRTKGQTERDVIAPGFARTHLVRPSPLLGQRRVRRRSSGRASYRLAARGRRAFGQAVEWRRGKPCPCGSGRHQCRFFARWPLAKVGCLRWQAAVDVSGHR